MQRYEAERLLESLEGIIYNRIAISEHPNDRPRNDRHQAEMELEREVAISILESIPNGEPWVE